MIKKILLAFSFTFFSTFVFAQQDSCNLRIGLLTCTPGTELYSIFGHSAIRVVDKTAGTDSIFNYGTFDFDDPAFLVKFVRGKLLYFVSVDPYENFEYQYVYEKRGITEQVLDLSCAEKQSILAFLRNNAKEENKYYKYDFVLDNCTTRLRDIILSLNKKTTVTKDVRPDKYTTFRSLIHEYLDKGKQYWNELGIDILLGSPIDYRISNEEAMFLPDYLLKALDSTTVNGKALVSEKLEPLKSTLPAPKAPLLSPFALFGIIFILIALISFAKKFPRFLNVFDFILFFLSGILGILLLFMWFGTDHQACRNNFNLIWAFPPHFIILFFFFKKRKWLKYYFLGTAIMVFLLIICWRWLPQEMNDGLLPVAGMIVIRSYFRYKAIK